MPIYYILLVIFQDILLYLLKVSQGPLACLLLYSVMYLLWGLSGKYASTRRRNMLIQTVTLAVTTLLSSVWYLEYPHLYSTFDIGLLIVSFVVSIYMIWSYYKAGV